MPDHVHAITRPLPVDASVPAAVFDLGAILHSVKGYSAQQIIRGRERTGPVWQDERYDRIVRDDREFEEFATYIRNNPVKAGLVVDADKYLWLYEAQDCE